MKKLLLSACLGILLFNISHAQITLNASDLAAPGKQYFFDVQTANLNTLNPGSAGTSQSWDFTALIGDNKDTTRFVSPSSTPYASVFNNSTIAETSEDGNYIFYSITNTAQNIEGIVTNSAALKPENPLLFLNFPTSYSENNELESNAKIVLVKYENTDPGTSQIYDSARAVMILTHKVMVDGWGEVKTPTGTYNSLRTKMVDKFLTSSEVRSTSSGEWTQAPGTTPTVSYDFSSYTWFANGIGQPVLSFIYVDTTFTTLETVSWYTGSAEFNPTSAIEALDAATNIAPNPSSGEFIIKMPDMPSVSITVSDIMGKEVTSYINVANGQVSLPGANNGIHSVKITTNKGSFVKRILVQK